MEKARTLAGDLALLDVNLAGELSYPVAEVLLSRNIPFVFATGYGLTALPEELRDVRVLPKPFRIKQLAEMLLVIRGD